MKIFIKHVLRNLKENKKRTLLIMMSLIFTGMFISTIISATNLVLNMDNVVVDNLSSGYDYVVSNKDGTPITKVQEKAVLKNVTKVGLFDDFGYIKIKDQEYLMNIYGADTTISYKVGIFSENNDQGFKLKEDEIVVLDSELEDLDLKIGDKITFYNSKGSKYELKIAKSISSDLNLIYEKGKYYTFATNLETFKKITEKEELKNHSYYISFNEKLSDKEKKDFENKCDEIGIRTVEKPESVQITSLLAILIPIIAVVILLLAVIVYFVNNSFVKIILNERIPIMGTFRSVGATPKLLDKILLLEMAFYGFISGVIGSILGFLFTRQLIKSLLIPFFENNLNGYDFNFLLKTIDNSAISIFIISIVCITVFQIVLSLKDIFTSSKKSIKDCIFSKYDDVQVFDNKNIMFGVTFLIVGVISIILKFKLNTFWGILCLILLFASISKLLPFIFKFILEKIKFKNPVYKMASGNVYNSKLQMGSSTILCILLCIIILLISFANEIKKENLFVDGKYTFDSFVDASSMSEEDINDISYVDGVKNIATLYSGTSLGGDMFLANNKVSSFIFLATDDAKTLIKTNKDYVGVDAKKLNNLKKNEIILSSDDAKRYGLKIGDYIYLNNVLKKEKFNVELPIYLKVVGLQEYSSKIAFINLDLMNELEKLGILSITKDLFIISEKNVEVTRNINKLLEEKSVSDRAKTLSEYLEDRQSETTISYVVVIIVCIGLSLIVLVCLINNQKISFLQRKKEFATLNSICMSRKQLKKLITTEIMISYILSSLIAVAYSIIIAKIVSYVMELPLAVTFSSIVIIFIVMWIVMYFVSLKIRKNINKINIIDEIKYE